MIHQNDFQYVRIGLASPAQIRSWAERRLPNGELVGCVSKPYTIHYQTHKPERDGLFCERIFGPIKSGFCACGKYQGINNIDCPKYCEQCGVELTQSKVRRHRMGYIRLECGVTHIWYLKNRPSLIARLLNQPLQDIESLVYYDSFLARPVMNQPRLLRLFATQSRLYKERRQSAFDEPLELFMFDESWQAALDRFLSSKWFNLIQQREMLTGGDVIDKLLMGLDLQIAMSHALNKWKYLAKKAPESQIKVIEAKGAIPQIEEERERDEAIQQQKDAVLRRVILIRDLNQAKIHPEWTVLFNLPVLPPDLRPIVELKDGQLIRSDLNELYRIILQRNQLISQLTVEAPSCISMMQKRLLQEAVDALLANGAGGNIIRDRNMRAYKSISDIIKGKKGRFRENLLGKRVDYSGRSVIVVGPSLALHQCGLPREMAIELFQPFIIRSLITKQVARNPRAAKTMIQRKEPIVWKILKTVISNHLVILNRAPTLHRLGIQAFQPILVKERAIHLHPLVCSGFNADFDGDQMAVHVPLSLEAQAEAHLLMSPYLNLLSSATGDAITLPSQDMLLGLYALTLGTTLGIYSHLYNKTNSIQLTKSQIPTLKNYSDMLITHHQGRIVPDSPLWLHWMTDIKIISTSQGESAIEVQYESQGINCNIYEHSQIRTDRLGTTLTRYIRTTAGRIIFNQQIEQAIQGTEQLQHGIQVSSVPDNLISLAT